MTKLEIDESKEKKPTFELGKKPAKKKRESKPEGQPIPEPKLESTHFLFLKETVTGNLSEVASYSDLKSFKEGIKDLVKALSIGSEIPKWVHFTGKFTDVMIEKKTEVKVKV